MSGRDEMIVIEIVKDGTSAQKEAAWNYLRSVSAMAEAELVNVSDIAQRKITLAVGRLRSEDLRSYSTSALLKSVNAILGKMLADAEILARRLVTANILSGKVKSLFGSRSKGELLISAIMLTDSDKERIEKIVSDTIRNLKHGASLTLASVTAMINKAAVRANMPHPTVQSSPDGKDKSEKKEEDDAPKQEPISNEFAGQQVEERRASLAIREQIPTESELMQIRSNPIQFANSIAAKNVNTVKTLQSEYKKREQENRSQLSRLANSGKGENYARNEVVGMEKEMLENGVSAFTDKGGKRWSLINYCAMTARTSSTTSDNTGEIYADEAHDLYYVVPHGGACPLCSKVQGKVYSRSGKNPKYPPLASIFNKIDPNGTDDLENTYLVIHPNCRHKIVKYTEKKEVRPKMRVRKK